MFPSATRRVGAIGREWNTSSSANNIRLPSVGVGDTYSSFGVRSALERIPHPVSEIDDVLIFTVVGLEQLDQFFTPLAQR